MSYKSSEGGHDKVLQFPTGKVRLAENHFPSRLRVMDANLDDTLLTLSADSYSPTSREKERTHFAIRRTRTSMKHSESGRFFVSTHVLAVILFGALSTVNLATAFSLSPHLSNHPESSFNKYRKSTGSLTKLQPWSSPSRVVGADKVDEGSCTRLNLAAASASTSYGGGLFGILPLLHGDSRFVLTAILWLSTFGISLERRTVVGKALSAPLATMALALIVANVGILPFSSPVYSMINEYLIPLAVPMLLFDSDLKRVVNDTGTLLLAFAIGAIATVVGTIVAFPLLSLKSLGPDVGWRVACALAARHIGGAINFVAVAETLKIGGSAVSAAIAADNVVVALYFAYLFSIAKPGEPGNGEDKTSPSQSESAATEEVTIAELAVEQERDSSTITLPTLAISISVAATLVSAGRFLTRALLPSGTSSLPLISALTVGAATIFPKFFARISETGTALGITFIQMFFAASGAAGSIRLVLKQAPALFAFSALQIGVHFGTLMAIGRGIFRLPHRELYLSSNANVGGPTTAAAMAQAKEWKRLVLPALLIGILGYATATGIALALGPILVRLPQLTRF